jgi:hypothetical protein
VSAVAEPGTRRLAPVLCSESSAERGESLGATASRADHWILLEYRRLWSTDVLPGSGLTEEVKAHLRRQLDALPRARLLFVKRPERRDAEEIALFFGATGEHGGRLYGLELESYDDVRRIDMAAALTGGAPAGEPVERLLVVCTHGKRDRCCALHGRPLYEALRRSGHAESVWQSTHVGGDRFAGNLVALPDGLYFGRVGPRDAAAVVDELAAGRIPLERYRGRSAYGFPVQAAERRVREETGLRGLADLRLAGGERTAQDAWRVVFRTEVDEREHELHVHEEHSEELAWLTCGSARPQPARRYVVTEYVAR